MEYGERNLLYCATIVVVWRQSRI